MRIIIRPTLEPQREVDVTTRLTAAIAEELWRLYGGNDKLNWLEAERHLQRIVGEARAAAREAPTGELDDPRRGAGVAESPRRSRTRSRAPARGGRARPAFDLARG